MKTFIDVLSFQYKFGVLPEQNVPHIPAVDVTDFRAGFMQEELNEFKDAVAAGDLPKAVDALLDLAYVVNGTALLMGLNPKCWEDCWDEVQRANMQKVRASGADDSRSKRKHSLDVVKPTGWLPPRHDHILTRHGWRP